MSLQCQLSLNVNTCVAGSSPAPMATLTVYNPNASSVSVTAIQMSYYNAVTGAPINSSGAPQLPAYSPGQTVSAPTLSSITFGPMPVAFGSAASMNSFWGPAIAGAYLANPQMGQPPQLQVLIGATVYASDGSINEAGRVGLMVSYVPYPPTAFQGGYFNFYGQNNFVTGLAFGAL